MQETLARCEGANQEGGEMRCQKCWEKEAVEGGRRCEECLVELSKLCRCLTSQVTEGGLK